MIKNSNVASCTLSMRVARPPGLHTGLVFFSVLSDTVDMETLLNLDRTSLETFCRRHSIRKLAVFGSQLTGTARPDSDVDLLVEFDPKNVPGLLALAAMEIELSDLMGGRKVDLRTPSDLSRHFRDEVVRTARVEYAA